MDTQRRRQLRRKYMDEEDRLHKSVLGRPYDAGDDDFDMDYKEPRKDYSPKLPKYKARTFKNILKEFDEPGFDERENSLKEYVREEITPVNQETFEKKIFARNEEPEVISEQPIHEPEETFAGKKFAEKQFAKEHSAEEQRALHEDYTIKDEVPESVGQSLLEPEEDPMPTDFPSDYEPQPIRRRKTLRQMEREERKARHESTNRTLNSSNNLSRPSAPRPVRIIAFLALMIFAFVLGYYLCGGVFRLTNFTPTTSEEQHQTTEETLPQPMSTQTAGVTKPATIYLPKDGAIVSATIEQKGASSNEQMLKDVLTSCLTSIKEAGFLSPETELAQLWITQDTLNLSFNQDFIADMKKLKAQEATLVLQSILRTANANLSSVKKLKIYSNFSPLTETKPIDFTRLWETM